MKSSVLSNQLVAIGRPNLFNTMRLQQTWNTMEISAPSLSPLQIAAWGHSAAPQIAETLKDPRNFPMRTCMSIWNGPYGISKNCASSSVSSSRQLRNSSQDWPYWPMGFQCVWLPWFTSLEGVVKRRCIGNEHYLPTVHIKIHTYIIIKIHTCMHCSQERTLASTASARISSQMWPLSFLGLH